MVLMMQLVKSYGRTISWWNREYTYQQPLYTKTTILQYYYWKTENRPVAKVHINEKWELFVTNKIKKER